MVSATSHLARRALAARAFLFDDPASYLAGVEDALRHLEFVGVPTGETPAAAIPRTPALTVAASVSLA